MLLVLALTSVRWYPVIGRSTIAAVVVVVGRCPGSKRAEHCIVALTDHRTIMQSSEECSVISVLEAGWPVSSAHPARSCPMDQDWLAADKHFVEFIDHITVTIELAAASLLVAER
jgi:hypothetical protein